jgi:hypothetical protein
MSTTPVLASKTGRISDQNPWLILKQLIISSAVNVRYCWSFSTDWLSGPPMTDRERIKYQAIRAKQQLRALDMCLGL